MKYYLTTPLYYVNAAPHIGHTYTTMVADMIERFKRMQGYDAVMFTGTDEHGQNVERVGRAPPGNRRKEFADTISAEFRAQWQKLGPVRSTIPAHHGSASITSGAAICSSAAWTTGTSIRAATPASTASSTNLYVNEAKPGDPCPDLRPAPRKPSPKRITSSSSRRFTEKLIELYEAQPDVHSARDAPQ